MAPERSFRMLAEDPDGRAQWVIDIQRGLEESGKSRGGKRSSREERGGGRREDGGSRGGRDDDAVSRYDNEIIDYKDDSDEKPARRDRERDRDRDGRGEREGRGDRDRDRDSRGDREREKERDSRGGDRDRERDKKQDRNSVRPSPPTASPQSAALLLAFDTPPPTPSTPVSADPFASLAARKTGGNGAFAAPSPQPLASPGNGGFYQPPGGFQQQQNVQQFNQTQFNPQFAQQPQQQQQQLGGGGFPAQSPPQSSQYANPALAGGVKVMPDLPSSPYQSGGGNPFSGDQVAALAMLQQQQQQQQQKSDPFATTFNTSSFGGSSAAPPPLSGGTSYSASSPFNAPSFSGGGGNSGAAHPPPLSGGSHYSTPSFASPFGTGATSSPAPPVSGGSNTFNMAAFGASASSGAATGATTYGAPASPFGMTSPAPPSSGGFSSAPRPSSPRGTFNTAAFSPPPTTATFAQQQAAYSPFNTQPALGSPVSIPGGAKTTDIKQMTLEEINAEIARLQNKQTAFAPAAASQPQSFSSGQPAGQPQFTQQFTQQEINAEVARMNAGNSGGAAFGSPAPAAPKSSGTFNAAAFSSPFGVSSPSSQHFQPMPIPGQQQFASPFGNPAAQPPTSTGLMDQQALQFQMQQQQQQQQGGAGQQRFF